MANKIIKGRDLMLFNSDGHSYAYATNHTLTITAETTDISSKDHGVWGASEVARYTWEITSENLYTTEEYDVLFDQMLSGEPITVRFGLKQPEADPSMNVADGTVVLGYWTSKNSFYAGKAVITSLVANANNGENATFSVTLSGSGAISKKTSGQIVPAPDINGITPFTETTSMTIDVPTGATVYYTTDGTTPNAESTVYSEAVTLSASTMVKAVAIKNNVASDVVSKAFVKEEVETPGE